MSNSKFEKLKNFIGTYHSAVIAFSGGTDSTFLSHVAGKVLEKRVLLVTASSTSFPSAEMQAAEALAADLKLPHRTIVSEETEIEGFAENTPDRCYYCKLGLFSKIRTIAEQEKFDVVFDGSNADDVKDYRPGRRALAELGIRSPLCEVGLTKQEIRALSAEQGLPTADKPAYACLASRFPYGEVITVDKLQRVELAEHGVKDLGFRQLRIRSHGDCARVEVTVDMLDEAWKKREEIGRRCKEAGFIFVALDTTGYRSGAMNEALKKGNC